MNAPLDTRQTIRSLSQEGYKYGFVTDIEADTAPPGLNEDTVRFISAKKGEPEWLLDWRLAAFRAWREMTEPDWAKVNIAPIDYQASTYYSAPKQQAGPTSLDEVDPELLAMYEKLGIPLKERAALAGVEPVGVAVDAVFDSVSVATTFKRELGALGMRAAIIPENGWAQRASVGVEQRGAVHLAGKPYSANPGRFARMRRRGITLPAHVGLPGSLRRRKLLEISLRVGVGDSVRYLTKHGGIVNRLVRRGTYRPDALIAGIAASLQHPASGSDLGIRGFHINTFNQVELVERWRQHALAVYGHEGEYEHERGSAS